MPPPTPFAASVMRPCASTVMLALVYAPGVTAVFAMETAPLVTLKCVALKLAAPLVAVVAESSIVMVRLAANCRRPAAAPSSRWCGRRHVAAPAPVTVTFPNSACLQSACQRCH